MLKKLIKYDFRSAGRLIGVLYLAVLAVAVLIGIVARIQAGRTINDDAIWLTGGDTAFLTLIAIYAILLIAMMLITVVMIILHFYRSLLQQEGYLMHTLPVPAWMHVASKTITGFVWMVLAGVVATASLLIAVGLTGFLKEMMIDLGDFWQSMGLAVSTPSFWLSVAAGIVGSVLTILTFYLALSIGNLANRHKIFYAILAFIVIIIVLTVIRNIAMIGSDWSPFAALFMADDPFASNEALIRAGNHYMIFQLIENLVLCVVFFSGTRWILQKKLNLE